MSDVPVQIVVAVFQTEQGAETILYELEAAKSAGYIGFQNAAVLRRDRENKLHNPGEEGLGRRRRRGSGCHRRGPHRRHSRTGAILVGAAGAVVGGLAAKLRDSRFDDNRLKKLGGSLTPGTSALVAVVEHKRMAEYREKLVQAGADEVTTVVTDCSCACWASACRCP